MLSLLAKLLKALNSESSTRQIALAIALALIFALSPIVSLQAFLILFVVLLIRVNLASFLVAAALFEGINIALSDVSVAVGAWLLTSEFSSNVFSSLYQFDWFKLGQWHHTYNLGSLVFGILLAVPVYFIAKLLVEKYRAHVKAYFEKLAIVKALKASRVFQIYQQLPTGGDK
jgi:uncharacterized protein (TIGR03546 family)